MIKSSRYVQKHKHGKLTYRHKLAFSRLNKYVKAEYCKQKYSLFQISKLFTSLRFQKAFKTAAGCYFEP